MKLALDQSIHAHECARMKRKKAVNLNLPSALREVSEAYAEANGRSLSTLVEDLLRRHLEARGINAEATNEQITATLAELKISRKAKQ